MKKMCDETKDLIKDAAGSLTGFKLKCRIIFQIVREQARNGII
jgi:hypothetical protein